MTFDEWHHDYAKRYEERGLDDVPPVADMQAAWNAAVEACAKVADEESKRGDYSEQVTAEAIAEDIRTLSTAKADAKTAE